ncbi:inositol-1-monophosphatase [Candidatus Doolittlea endobia]|uniref:Inositol-1-monophosphatase n=1 Tax=Candidatus Doolittlea endobia TaxID=1778262 RepID=A0A143WRJ2_9ENTR|nr:inositol-1-monophosphatase [Candidatus Doolittlea endobia]CUX96365.1 Inositol-1-monophosphatase [Candidatus Doolittlea endobia]
MHPMLNIAIRAVRKAGNLIAKYYETLDVVETIQKGTNDFITNVNLEVERLIVEVIYKSYPQHVIRVKGNVVRAGKNNEVEWIIDPLSGATNFVKRFPYFAVSITVRIKGRTEITVVYDPMRNELFSASRGQGAQLNGYRLRGSTARDLDGTILATGFPFKNKQNFTNYTNIVSELFIQCADFRYTGSATLDLAYVAAGRVDGFFETCMKPWDFAGGELLVREAGGVVTDVTGDYNYLRSGNIVAGGNPHVVKSMLLILRAALSEALNIS